MDDVCFFLAEGEDFNSLSNDSSRHWYRLVFLTLSKSKSLWKQPSLGKVDIRGELKQGIEGIGGTFSLFLAAKALSNSSSEKLFIA